MSAGAQRWLYALFATGLSLIFGVMRLVIIAHGDFIVCAAFLAFVVINATGLHPLLTFATAVAIIGGLQLLFYRTALGRAFRATSGDGEIAEIMGLDRSRVFGMAMALSMAVVAVAGVFLAIRANFDPFMGPSRLIFGFEAGQIDAQIGALLAEPLGHQTFAVHHADQALHGGTRQAGRLGQLSVRGFRLFRLCLVSAIRASLWVFQPTSAGIQAFAAQEKAAIRHRPSGCCDDLQGRPFRGL